MSNIYGIDIRDFFRRQAEPEPTNYDIVAQYFKPVTKKPDHKTKYKTIEPLKDNKFDTVGNVARKWKQLTEHHVKVEREVVKPITIEAKTNKQLIDDMIHNKPNMYNRLVYHNPEYNTKPRNKKVLSAITKYEKEPNGLPSVISTYEGDDYSEEGEGYDNVKERYEKYNYQEDDTIAEQIKKKEVFKELEKVSKGTKSEDEGIGKQLLKGIEKAKIEEKEGKTMQSVVRKRALRKYMEESGPSAPVHSEGEKDETVTQYEVTSDNLKHRLNQYGFNVKMTGRTSNVKELDEIINYIENKYKEDEKIKKKLKNTLLNKDGSFLTIGEIRENYNKIKK